MRHMVSRHGAYRIWLILNGGTSRYFSMIVTANLIYQMRVARLNPLQLMLVGTVLETTAFVCQAPTSALSTAALLPSLPFVARHTPELATGPVRAVMLHESYTVLSWSITRTRVVADAGGRTPRSSRRPLHSATYQTLQRQSGYWYNRPRETAFRIRSALTHTPVQAAHYRLITIDPYDLRQPRGTFS